MRLSAAALAVLLCVSNAFAQKQNNCGAFVTDGRWDAAFDVCTEEAGAGDAAAQKNLGGMYVQGLGVDRNDTETLRHFSLATLTSRSRS